MSVRASARSNPHLFWRAWLPLYAYAALIFAQSHFPSPEMPPIFSVSDKLLHLAAYAVMGVLCFRAFHARWPQARLATLCGASAAAAAFYGVTDELHQAFIPSRSADLLDWAADALGGLLGAALFLLWIRFAARLNGPAARRAD